MRIGFRFGKRRDAADQGLRAFTAVPWTACRTARHSWRLAYIGIFLTLASAFSSPALSAQLISPGALSDAHADLEGFLGCTNCHELGRRGASDAKCLTCHEPLRIQIQEDRGLHAAYESDGCATCHKDHFGRDFDVIRFDSLAFEHVETTFELIGAHADAGCRSCHTSDLIKDPNVLSFNTQHQTGEGTFLGLGTQCLSCHQGDDPHGNQFQGQVCTNCHTQTEWIPAPGFDHGNTRYPLTGRHAKVDCAACHTPSTRGNGGGFLDSAPTAFGACTTCHQDTHNGDMGQECTTCHSTSGWTQLSGRFEATFEHAGTGFALNGVHTSVNCVGCHGPSRNTATEIDIRLRSSTVGSRYPTPVTSNEQDCMACHVDHHDESFEESPGGATCTRCHSDTAWLPTSFDLSRHQVETTFPLTGAHVATPCVGCHNNPKLGQAEPDFEFAATTCATCHVPDDPHGEQFAGRSCETCHSTSVFAEVAIDHAETRFPLDGEHRSLECNACHLPQDGPDGIPTVLYRPLATECRNCHSGQAPWQLDEPRVQGSRPHV